MIGSLRKLVLLPELQRSCHAGPPKCKVFAGKVLPCAAAPRGAGALPISLHLRRDFIRRPFGFRTRRRRGRTGRRHDQGTAGRFFLPRGKSFRIGTAPSVAGQGAETERRLR
jgi:hypothetical protein